MWKNWFPYKNKDGAILALAQRYDGQPQKVRKISLRRGTVSGALLPVGPIEIRSNELSAEDNRSCQAMAAIHPGALSAPGIHESQKRTRQSSEREEKD